METPKPVKANPNQSHMMKQSSSSPNKRRPMSIMKEALADTLICQVFKAVDPDGTMGLAFQSGKPVMTGLPEKAGPANRQKGLEIS